MTSKNSFLARLIENGKRRLWLLVVSILAFVVELPTFTAMYLSVIAGRYEAAESQMLQKELYSFASGMYSVSNGFVFFVIGAFAAMCAVQGFSYLYDRSKIDFYHSKPVKAATRFFSIWTNGIVVFIVPYLVGTFLNLMIFAANGVLDVKLFQGVWIYVLLAIFFFVGIYHVAILALMLTGKLGVTCLGIVVLLAYEVCVRALIWVYHGSFYHFYNTNSYEVVKWIKPALSPVTYLMNFGSKEWNLGITILVLALFAAVVLVIAFLCYKKRPTELAGSAMTFSVTKPIIKIGVAVPAALFVGVWSAYMVDYSSVYGTGNPGFPIFIGILVLLIVCCLIQVIYEADIKGIIHKKAEFVITFAIAMGIALFFRFDLSGYDTRIPDAEDIEYATLATNSGEYWSTIYLDENLEWKYKEEYVDKHMRLTGETAQAVRDLMEESIKLYMEQPDRDTFHEVYEGQKYNYVTFGFCLKNGKHLNRVVPVVLSKENIAAYIEKIENSEEFIYANEPAMSEYLLAEAMSGEWEIRGDWGNGLLQEKLTSTEALALLQAYRLDLLKCNYHAKKSSLPIGQFDFYLYTEKNSNSNGYYHGREIVCKIYPEFSNSIACLEKNGYETENFLAVDDIEKIMVERYYPTDEEETVQEEVIYYDSNMVYEETIVSAHQEIMEKNISYTERGQMEEILENIHSANLDYDEWYKESPYEEQYYIQIFFKTDSPYYDEYDYSADYYFLKGQIPDFVKKDLPDRE